MRSIFVAAVIGFAVPLSAFAASGDTMVIDGWVLPSAETSTGATLESALQLLDTRLGNLDITDISPFLTNVKTIIADRSRDAHDRERRAAAMEECRSQLRKANRDGTFFVALRCVRTILLQDLATLRRKENRNSVRTDISAGIRDAAITTTMQLNDAIIAVVNAIDTGVYDGIEDLEDMKQRLFVQYRLPDLQSDLLLRIDRLRHWTAYLAGRIRLLSQDENAASPETMRDLSQAADCLGTVVDGLDAAQAEAAERVVERASLIRSSEQSLGTCLSGLRGVTSKIVQLHRPTKTSK